VRLRRLSQCNHRIQKHFHLAVGKPGSYPVF
jgi:hypothetical protein